MILKIQKPIVSVGTATYLIYNKDRSVISQSLEIGQIPEVDAMFGEDDLKVYIKGYIDKKGRLVINKKVEEQDW